MANVAHMAKKVKQKVGETVLDPAQRRVTHIVHAQQRLKNVKIRHVPMHYPVKSGNAAAQNQ